MRGVRGGRSQAQRCGLVRNRCAWLHRRSGAACVQRAAADDRGRSGGSSGGRSGRQGARRLLHAHQARLVGVPARPKPCGFERSVDGLVAVTDAVRLDDELAQVAEHDRGTSQVLGHQLSGPSPYALQNVRLLHLTCSIVASRGTLWTLKSNLSLSENRMEKQMKDAEVMHFGCSEDAEELQKGYSLGAVRMQSAFGLLSRSRPILRLVRAVTRTKDCVLADGNGFADSPRGDTPYAPTRCPQTRMRPRNFGMTCRRPGTTPLPQTRMVAG